MSQSTADGLAFVPAVFPQGASVLRGWTAARYGSPDASVTLAGATLVFYDGQKGSGDGQRTVWGFKPAPENHSLAEIGRAAVADDGSFQVVLRHAAETVLVGIEVERLSYAPATGKRAFGLLGVAPLAWHRDGGFALATLSVSLPHGPFCSLLKMLDLWLVAGNVSGCSPHAPLSGASVTAFDRDIIQDDTLGTALTDAAGEFRIFFQSAAFKEVPLLPPPFDAIGPHELVGGPDVYFHVSHGGNALLEEPGSTGRQAGRENVQNCSYHRLCVQAPVFAPPQTVTLWTDVGDYQVPDGGGLRAFDADGLTAAGKLAFTGNLDFNGQLSQQYLGEAVSFRFVFAEWSTLTTAPAYPAEYQPLTAAHLDLNARYGSLYTALGPNPWDYSLEPVLPAPDADGWVAVDQSPALVRTTARLVRVRTTTLVAPIPTAGLTGTSGAGVPVPAGPLRDRPRKFSFVLEIRTASTSAHQAVPVPLHINNSAPYLHFELEELQANACTSITPAGGTITVHPRYTVAHAYLRDLRIIVQRQGGSVLNVKEESYTSHPAGWSPPAGAFGTETAVYGDIGNCSYRSILTATRRLTNGYGGVGQSDALRTFCVG